MRKPPQLTRKSRWRETLLGAAFVVVAIASSLITAGVVGRVDVGLTDGEPVARFASPDEVSHALWLALAEQDLAAVSEVSTPKAARWLMKHLPETSHETFRAFLPCGRGEETGEDWICRWMYDDEAFPGDPGTPFAYILRVVRDESLGFRVSGARLSEGNGELIARLASPDEASRALWFALMQGDLVAVRQVSTPKVTRWLMAHLPKTSHETFRAFLPCRGGGEAGEDWICWWMYEDSFVDPAIPFAYILQVVRDETLGFRVSGARLGEGN